MRIESPLVTGGVTGGVDPQDRGTPGTEHRIPDEYGSTIPLAIRRAPTIGETLQNRLRFTAVQHGAKPAQRPLAPRVVDIEPRIVDRMHAGGEGHRLRGDARAVLQPRRSPADQQMETRVALALHHQSVQPGARMRGVQKRRYEFTA